jgi:hypothetical protein
MTIVVDGIGGYVPEQLSPVTDIDDVRAMIGTVGQVHVARALQLHPGLTPSATTRSQLTNHPVPPFRLRVIRGSITRYPPRLFRRRVMAAFDPRPLWIGRRNARSGRPAMRVPLGQAA